MTRLLGVMKAGVPGDGQLSSGGSDWRKATRRLSDRSKMYDWCMLFKDPESLSSINYIKTVSVFHGFNSPSPSLFVHLVRNPNMWFLQKEATTCSLLGGFIPSPGPIGSTSTSRRWSVSPGRSVKRSTGCALHSAERTLAETWENCSNNSTQAMILFIW